MECPGFRHLMTEVIVDSGEIATDGGSLLAPTTPLSAPALNRGVDCAIIARFASF